MISFIHAFLLLSLIELNRLQASQTAPVIEGDNLVFFYKLVVLFIQLLQYSKSCNDSRDSRWKSGLFYTLPPNKK